MLADLHGWGHFVKKYKQIPITEDNSDEKRILTVLKSVEGQREKKKSEKARKTNKCKSDSFGRAASTMRFSNEIPAFPSMSTCYLCGNSGHFWRSCLHRTRTRMLQPEMPDSYNASRYSCSSKLSFLPLKEPSDHEIGMVHARTISTHEVTIFILQGRGKLLALLLSLRNCFLSFLKNQTKI